MPSGSKGGPLLFYIPCQPVYLYHSTSPHHRSSVEFIINVSPFIIPLTRYKLCIYLRRKVISTFYSKPRWDLLDQNSEILDKLFYTIVTGVLIQIYHLFCCWIIYLLQRGLHLYQLFFLFYHTGQDEVLNEYKKCFFLLRYFEIQKTTLLKHFRRLAPK